MLLRTAIVEPEQHQRTQLKSLLSGLELVWVESELSDYDSATEALTESPPDLLFIGVDSDTDAATALISTVSRRAPSCGICALSQDSDGQLILRTVRAGAKEFLTLPVNMDELIATIRTLGSSAKSSAAGARVSSTIAVAGVTGGVGSTSVAVNLGCILAADPNKSVVLVDLDLTLGDADVFLDMIHDYTLVDLTQNISRLDYDLLRRSIARHACGLHLLPRPVELLDAEYVTPDSFSRVLKLLNASFTHVIVDLSKAYNQLDLEALRTADTVLVVTQLDLASLRNVVRLLKSFRGIDELSEKIKLVVNRDSPETAPIRLKKAQEIVGQPFSWRIPNDYRLMVEACNNGTPLIELAPRAEITQSLTAIANSLSDEHGPDVKEAEKRSPNLARWFGRWGASATKTPEAVK